MRSVELAKLAAQAEAIRLKQQARRQVMRAVFGAIAGLFALAALVAAHVLIGVAIARSIGAVWASVVVLAMDVALAAVLAMLAMRNQPSQEEQEALTVRNRALDQAKEALALSVVLAPVARMVGRKYAFALTLGALATRFLSR